MNQASDEVLPKGPKRLNLSLYLRREPVMLALLTGLAIVSFLAVTGLSHLYLAQQQSLAVRWSARGVADLNARRFKTAIVEFRTALLYSRGNDAYQLSLAQALMGLGRTDEAYAYLINLWERQPENGVVNLDLARIAVEKKQAERALRFYHNAIYATWPDNQETERRKTRLELIDYLLQIDARTQAESELIALEANVGDDAAQQANLGRLFLRTQDPNRALAAFRTSLRLDRQMDRQNPAADTGAGEAAFDLGQYAAAERYLRTAVAASSGDTASAARLKTTESVLKMDPFRPGISVSERNSIVLDAFAAAGDRMKACGAQSGTSSSATASSTRQNLARQWAALKPQITERGLRQDPDRINAAMNLTFAIERQNGGSSGGSCTPPTDTDKALLLIANLHEEN